MDFGQNWADQAKTGSAAAGEDGFFWTLVLETFTEPGHETAARTMIADLPQIAPQVRGATVHTTAKGSMVIYGHYTGRDDPASKTDQENLKKLTYQGHPVFNRVLLTRLEKQSNAAIRPLDLRAARLAHPKVDPLYTLDVAIWMTNDDPKARDRISYAEVRQRAEAYAAELRARQFEAYFYHDDATQWSIVTVGLFDRRAIDSKSGLFSAEVTRLMNKFPARLVNGEPLMELKDRRNPKSGATPQKPRLVLVPEM